MQSSRKHIRMRCVIQPHRHIDISNMKSTTYSHENILNITLINIMHAYRCSHVVSVSSTVAI
jgi:hypothetical protein